LEAGTYGKGQIRDLEEAIRVTQQAVDSIPEDHPDRAGMLNNLGNKLGVRYNRTGEINCLENAIKITQEAVKLTPEGNPDQARRLSKLGIRLERRYQWIEEEKDLDEAIQVTRLAVNLTPGDHPDLAMKLNNLGDRLKNEYERAGSIEDLEEAIQVAQRAVDLTPEGHPDRAAWLCSLGSKLHNRYKRTGEIAKLEKAIKVTQQAVNSTAKDHLNRGGRLKDLRTQFESRYKRTEDTNDLKEASACFQGAWDCQIATPYNRVTAAAHCLKLLEMQRKVGTAAQLGKDMINLLPTVNTRLLDRSDRQFVMSFFAGVAADVCAFLLESNRPDKALQYLEKCRAVIIGQLLDDRSDKYMSILIQQHPKIARRYKALVDDVNTPLHSLNRDSAGKQIFQRRREAKDELDACINEIRSLPGYELLSKLEQK
jgi:tetratricopeptide (TPR) repeat protein